MASKIPAWGIDVGQCSLKAMKMQAAEDGVALLAYDVVEHETLLSQAETDAGELIRKALETFVSRNDLAGSRVAISVPGQQTLTRFTKMPPVERKKIPDMVKYEASQQIPFDMDEVVWDYQVFTEEDSPDVEVGIFAIRKELIRTYLSSFTDLGIEPVLVQTAPMASYNSALFERPPAEGEAQILLDMGALTTDLIVMEGGRIWSRPIPLGGNRFTEALVSAFKIPFSKAEKLKRNAAASKYARQIFQAMRPVFADLVSEIQRSIGFYTSTHRDANVVRVLGMGNAFKLPALQKFLQQNLQIDVDRFTGFKKLTVVGDTPDGFKHNVMSSAVAYGLALQGLGLAAVTSSLLPLEVQRTLLWRKKRPWLIGSAAAVALSAGSLWVGNVTANGQIQQAMGTLSSPTAIAARSIDDAERLLREAATSPPIESAAKVAGAAQYLSSEYSRAAGGAKGDVSLLKDMANRPKGNVFVPRVIEALHDGFAAARSEARKRIDSVEAYQALAKKEERPGRAEVYIRKMQFEFDEVDPRRFRGGNITDRRVQGWLIQVVGQTSVPQVLWIDETLKPALLKAGRRPGRGIYIHSIELVTHQPWSRDVKIEDVKQPDDTGGSRGGRGGRPGMAPPGGRPGMAPPGGRPGGRPPSDRGSRGGGPGLGQPSGGSRSLDDEIRKLTEESKYTDPVTGEKLEKDFIFTLDVFVHISETPPDLIPDEYKTATDDDEKNKG